MSRFALLERELNKGVTVDTKSNVVIHNWSPNNVRRLIIGVDFVIVNYFVSGGKYNNKTVLLDLRRSINLDRQQLVTEPDKYIPIIEVLTRGRILSSVEEVLFCTEGYPPDLLQADTNMSKLSKGNTTLEKRFPRLRYVSAVAMKVSDIPPHLAKIGKSEASLLDILKEDGKSGATLLDFSNENWYKQTSLRPQWYSMDGDILQRYFDKIKTEREAKDKQEKLDSLTADKNKEVIVQGVATSGKAIKIWLDLINKGQQVYTGASIINKADWAKLLQGKAVIKGLRIELTNTDIVNQIRRIDFETILSSKYQGVQEENLHVIKQLRDMLFTDIFPNETEYKRDSNKSTIKESMTCLNKTALILLATTLNISYLAYTSYLTRNSLEYAEYYFDLVKSDIPSLKYTRRNIEYCNKHQEDGLAKKALDKTTAVEVMVDEFPLDERVRGAKKLLSSLNKVSKEA